ncbi:kallikrein-11 isoform X2 [Myotis daubentonii]|uniref:kallikrein-11 isoform X2 n=1 Tax=Myotis daubentonii TaxID=98922 RepID=UPI002872DEE2|nr:kallikrein-11 isoform X2 [Myotis daubentonii]
MKKLSLAGVESPVPRHRGSKRQHRGLGPGLAAGRTQALPGDPAPHLVRGERRHHRKQIDLITSPKTQGLPLDCAGQETEVAQVWEGIGPGSHSQSTWGLPSSPPLPTAPGHDGSAINHAGSGDSQYIVHLGMHHLQRHDGWEQTRRATESFPHPDFDNSVPNKDHRNDIMLVKLASPAVITWAVRPLTLSSRCVAPGTRCLISGWGTTSSPQLRLPQTLRCANITIIDHKECENAYPGNITDTMVCASVREEGKDSCQGDSGGPLVCNGSLQGIISWGQDPCAVSRKPGVYTKVCKYVDWIHETMKNN